MADVRYSVGARPRPPHLRLVTPEFAIEPGLCDPTMPNPRELAFLLATARIAHGHVERLKGALSDGDVEAARAFAIRAGVETKALCGLAESVAGL